MIAWIWLFAAFGLCLCVGGLIADAITVYRIERVISNDGKE